MYRFTYTNGIQSDTRTYKRKHTNPDTQETKESVSLCQLWITNQDHPQ